MFASKFMRIISVMGIIALLTLQYFWLNNAYRMVERDMMEKCKGCLKEAIDEELLERMNSLKIKDISIVDQIELKPGDEIFDPRNVNEGDNFNRNIQELMIMIKCPCNIEKVDTLFLKKIQSQFDFIPKYTLRIFNDSAKHVKVSQKTKNRYPNMDSLNKNETASYKDVIFNNSIYVKLTSEQSIELVLTSPTKSIITKSKYIFIVSILLVLLIGVILIFQLKNMIKDKEFTKFMKDYARILAHETRTPVNDIYMLTSRLMSDDFVDPVKRKSYYNECLSQCSKLFLGIDNILLVAKSEQSKFMIIKSTVDMRVFICKIADKYRNNYFLRKDLKIEASCNSEEYIAYFDADLMENVIFNLIENAIKYSKDVLLITLSCSIENKHIFIKIKDNGIGISEKDIKHVFQIFERGKKVPSNQIKGFGIGLYYVYKVVKAHKGKVTINSTEGVGSEFIIDIPNRFL
ncbi:MAG: HAMP domain-containing sensor histidine kinase [Bacteroidales bacterium]|nr:HAMP domain-containing sensor histidine kinase [Bacteroidales bacterium]